MLHSVDVGKTVNTKFTNVLFEISVETTNLLFLKRRIADREQTGQCKAQY